MIESLTGCKSAFVNAVKQTLQNLSREDEIKVKGHLLKILGQYTAPYVLSQDLVMELAGQVFEDEVLRDWLLNTRFVFFMDLASSHQHAMTTFVVDQLARSASLDLGLTDEFNDEDSKAKFQSLNLAPEQFSQEILDYREARLLLAANSWLVVILLTLAFLHLEHEIFVVPAGRK